MAQIVEGCLVPLEQVQKLAKRHVAYSKNASEPQRMVGVAKEPIFLVDFELSESFAAKNNWMVDNRCVCGGLQG